MHIVKMITAKMVFVRFWDAKHKFGEGQLPLGPRVYVSDFGSSIHSTRVIPRYTIIHTNAENS